MGRWQETTLRAAAVVAVREDDQALLRFLSILPVATAAQILALAYPGRNPRTVAKHLYRLGHRGILARLRIPARSGKKDQPARGVALWYLTPAGRQAAAAIWGGDPEAPHPLPPLTTPRGAALAWAAAAVTEWVVQCRTLGVEMGLAVPGPELGWPGWPPVGGKEPEEPPPLLAVRLRDGRTLAVDFLRPGGTIPATRRRLYGAMLSRQGGAPVNGLLIVGWGASTRELGPGIYVAEPNTGANWVLKFRTL